MRKPYGKGPYKPLSRKPRAKVAMFKPRIAAPKTEFTDSVRALCVALRKDEINTPKFRKRVVGLVTQADRHAIEQFARFMVT